ncbi:SDR family NAD(P)-dependent oxidoreductase [Catenuloplanes atrovinosus]|uniref:Short-subunit dehydrogenase n=1 Tax=Catenuloplanes atrovinosus TaxID=137266 RepID=A0AAE3YUU6_9ACTN|nr:SDR family NAD(P)-dependent oxidoreductase [Catenuloplanes atrovinosus]MDR7280070.1 short-subunit dehydrogenase [Catenuloplanes atrovinosus]
MNHSDETVLITGASSGIGAAFARLLAARGSDLVLVARRIDRLDSLAAELRTAYRAHVEVIACDLSEDAPGERLLAETAARGITVTSVVNNAGAGLWARLADSDPARLRQVVALNATAVMDVSRAFLPAMMRRRAGYLLNVSSLGAYSSTPMQAVYSAAKAFVLSFTEALWAETRGSGVRVLALAPGITSSEFFEALATDDPASRPGRAQTPAQVAETGLRVIERRNPPPSWVSGHLNHALALAPRYFTRRRAVLLTAASTMRNASKLPAVHNVPA